MKYLLDTCVISDFVKGDENTIRRIKETNPLLIAVSSITAMEIEYGLLCAPEKTKKIAPVLHDLLSAIKIIPFTQKEALEAARIRAILRAKGTPIGPYDFLIAATALSHEMVLVTSNIKEFDRIENLKVENWR